MKSQIILALALILAISVVGTAQTKRRVVAPSHPQESKFVDLDGNGRLSQWRIKSVNQATDKTTVLIEIRCVENPSPSLNHGDVCVFFDFNSFPLLLTDNAYVKYKQDGSIKYADGVYPSQTQQGRIELKLGQTTSIEASFSPANKPLKFVNISYDNPDKEPISYDKPITLKYTLPKR